MYILKNAENKIIMTGTINEVLQERYLRDLREEDTRIEAVA